MTQPTETILRGHEDWITLVFAGRLQQDKQLTFAFSWPAVLASRRVSVAVTRASPS